MVGNSEKKSFMFSILFRIMSNFNQQNDNSMSQLKAHTPKNVTILISAILVLIGQFGGSIDPFIAQNGDWIVIAGYVLLLLGVYLKGL